MLCTATRPRPLSTHLSAPIAPRWSRLPKRKDAHRGLAGSCRAASRPTPSQVLKVSGENAGCVTKARRTPLLPQGNQLAEVVVTARKWLCTAGNFLAEGADKLGNVSGKLELGGLGVAGVSVVAAQPEGVAVGLGLAATGGTGNIIAGGLQVTAGLLQGVGGGGFGNAGYGALSLATGFTLARGIVWPAASGYRTVSQRAADAFANGTATVAGGVNDLWTSLIDSASPQQVGCPGGH